MTAVTESPLPPFSIERDVTPTDVDDLGHVNNVVFLAWINQVAIAHWEHLTSSADRAALAWVALRHEIDYRAEAKLGERVRITTWTGAARGLRYWRHTRVDAVSDVVPRLLAEAATIWCPIDRVRRRPVRPAEHLRRLFAA